VKSEGKGKPTQQPDVSKYVKQSIGEQSISSAVVVAVDRFFLSMQAGEVTTNSLLVQYLEAEGVKITNTIKTDVAMAAVKASNAYAKGQGSVKMIKVNPSNKWSQWVYKKL